MSIFKIGDIVALTAGSMRMAVESIDEENVSTVWCNEGIIGRDTFPVVLLKKWESREGGDRGAPRPYRGDREGGGNKFDDKPKGKPGWDGKPREKKFFRKD